MIDSSHLRFCSQRLSSDDSYGGFYAPGPYLTNERQTHMLEMMLKKMGFDESAE